MITNVTYDLAQLRRERERIELHIGRMSVAAAAIDQKITSLLAIALRAHDRSVAERVFNNEIASLKLKFLARALPPAWEGGAELVRSIREIENYRNGLSHSTLVTRMAVLEGSATHHGVREKKNLTPEKIELDQLEPWEDRASVVHAVVYGLVAAAPEDFAPISLRQIALSFFADPTESLLATIDLVYPK